MTSGITASELLFYFNTAVQLYLSFFFLHKHKKDHNRISIVWSAGFMFYSISGIIFEAMQNEVLPKDQLTLFMRSTLIASGIALFYYGTSLLFFDKGSFKREIASLLLILAMLFTNVYIIYIHNSIAGLNHIVDVMNNVYVYVFLIPVFSLMSYLFAKASKDLKYGDPRHINLILVSAGWGGIALSNFFYPMTYTSEMHAIVRGGAIVSRLLLLVGMIKSAATMSQK